MLRSAKVGDGRGTRDGRRIPQQKAGPGWGHRTKPSSVGFGHGVILFYIPTAVGIHSAGWSACKIPHSRV